MKLFLLKRTDTVDYDEFAGFVIRAENEKRAREIANERGDTTQWNDPENWNAGLSPSNIWMADSTVVVEISEDGDARIILEDYRAG